MKRQNQAPGELVFILFYALGTIVEDIFREHIAVLDANEIY